MHKYTCLVNSIATPMQVGVYFEDVLIEQYIIEGKTSDVLPLVFEKILEKYTLQTIVYVNGPGSYMAIKVAYIFLKTLSITKQIEFKACSGFVLNENSPIKALGKKYFFNRNGKIDIDECDISTIKKDFKLPNDLSLIEVSDDTLPNYNLPAV